MTHAYPHTRGRSEEETNTSCLQKLGINTAELEGAGDPVDGQHIGRNAVVDLVDTRKAHHFIEGIIHHVEEALIYLALPPAETLTVLHPFEIADGYAAGVAKNIRHGEDALGIDNRVGLPGGGAVRALAENPGLHLTCILLRDLVFNRGRYGNLARLEEHIARAHLRSAAGEILKLFLLRVDPVDRLRHVESLLVIKAAADVRESYDFVARFVHQVRGQGAHVAKALDNDSASFFLDAEFREGLIAANHHAAPGGFAPSARAAQLDGLAGHHGRGGLAEVHGVRVHDPGHGLLVCADVGGRDVLLRAQPIRKFRG